MTAKQIIEMALAYKGMNKTQLASKLGWTKQLFAARLETGKFSVDEWEAIGKAMECEVEIAFIFPDGRRVGLRQ